MELCENSNIRLQGGNSLREGRVEICKNQTWGTVCDDGWDTNDATVACRQLRYSATGINMLVIMILAKRNTFFNILRYFTKH